MVCFAKALEMYNLPLPQELNNIIYIRVIAKAKNVVIGDAGLLLCCNHESATSYKKSEESRQILSAMRSILR